MEEDECGVAARLFALLRCVDHLGEAKASRVFSSNEKECIFMLDAKVAALLNEQVNKEFYSAYLYLDFANFYTDQGTDYLGYNSTRTK